MSLAELFVIVIVAVLVLRREHLNNLVQILAKIMQQVQSVKQIIELRMDEQFKQIQLQQNLEKAEEAEKKQLEMNEKK